MNLRKVLSLLTLAALLANPAYGALPFTFSGLSGNVPASDLDSNFNATGAMGVFQCSATGTNTLVLTTAINQPTLSSYTAYNSNPQFGFVAPSNSTGAVTININGIAAAPLYLADATTQATTGNIVSGVYYVIAYNVALNSGIGGFQITSSAGAPSGRLLNVQVFTSSGTYTPTVGTNTVLINGIGGGGGGGGGGAGNNGGPGGTTSVGSLLSLGGGGGGVAGSSSPGLGGTGGAVITATVGIQGSSGGPGAINSTSLDGIGGDGAPGLNGGGTVRGGQGGNGLNATANTGAGGGGGSGNVGVVNSGGGGGAGAQGFAYATGITGTYTVTIGLGGTAGVSGSGFGGGTGGIGYVYIFEYN